jgi:hypothetical protein
MPMREILRLLAAGAVAVAVLHALGLPLGAPLGVAAPAYAQQQVQQQAPTKQIKLTEKQVEGFIAVQKKMATAKGEAEFEAIAKQHGFASLDEHDDVETNILLVMDGIDPKTKAFSEPPVVIKRHLDEIAADKQMPEADRKQALQELNEALKVAKPIQFPGNIELVKKYYDQIQAALE